MKRAQSSGAISSICTTRRMWSARTVDIPTAALLTSTSRRPKRAIVRLTLSRQAAGSDTSSGQRDGPVGAELAVETQDAVLGRVAQRHAHAGTDKGAREGLADAAGGAGDERDAAVEVGCGHAELPIERRGKFLDHLDDFARALDGRSPDTIELRDLGSQRGRVQDVLGLFDTGELVEGEVNKRVGPAPAAPSSLSLVLPDAARKVFCPVPRIEFRPIGQVVEPRPNDENGCGHGRLLGGLFLRNRK